MKILTLWKAYVEFPGETSPRDISIAAEEIDIAVRLVRQWAEKLTAGNPRIVHIAAQDSRVVVEV